MSEHRIKPANHTQPFKSLRPPSGSTKDPKRMTQLSQGWKTKSKLWLQSSSSMTRDRAPSHKIPQAHRFHTDGAYSDRRKSASVNHDYNESVMQMVQKGQGITFAKSTRPQHFIKRSSCSVLTQNDQGDFQDRPSYNIKKRMRSQPIEAASECQTVRPKQKVKGGTIGRSTSRDKEYLLHSRNRPYVIQNGKPGPGRYNLNWANKRKQIRYTFRAALQNYNDTKNVIPGPATYDPQQSPQKAPSSNAQGTLAKSRRNFLTKFPDGPGPDQYEIDSYLKNSH